MGTSCRGTLSILAAALTTYHYAFLYSFSSTLFLIYHIFFSFSKDLHNYKILFSLFFLFHPVTYFITYFFFFKRPPPLKSTIFLLHHFLCFTITFIMLYSRFIRNLFQLDCISRHSFSHILSFLHFRCISFE